MASSRRVDPHGNQKSSSRSALFDLAPLRGLFWWLALAVLLVNDHLLKGSGTVPAWLTGKLSDFAFLVVAPVLLACLLPARLAFRRFLAFTFVSLVFSLAKLSTGVSIALVAWLSQFGLHWQLWTDATDLVALAVLPAAWWLVAKQQNNAWHVRRRGLELAALAIGILACLATSAMPRFQHNPFFVNDTAQTQTVSFTWLLRQVDCTSDLAGIATTLNPGDLGDAHTIDLTSGQVAALDQPPVPGVDGAGICRNSNKQYYGDAPITCSAVVLDIASGPAVLVTAPAHWEEQNSGGLSCGTSPDPVTLCQPVMPIDEIPGDDALSLNLEGGHLAFKAGSKLKMISIDLAQVMARPQPSSSCGAQRDQILALIDGTKTCASDADCQVLAINLAMPGNGLCNVYVNKSLSFSSIAAAEQAWGSSCVTDPVFSCTTNAPVQSPACLSGRCSAPCPGVDLPICNPLCQEWGTPYGGTCAVREGAFCYTSAGQACHCIMQAGSPVLTCTSPTPIEACRLACSSYYPIDTSDPNSYDGGMTFMDGSVSAIDEANSLDANSGNPVFSMPAIDLRGAD